MAVGFWRCKLSSGNNSGDVGVDALVPVQEALDVDGIADLQSLDSLVDLSAGAAQVGFHAEGVGVAIEFKNGEPGDDIYVTVSKDGAEYSFCVERYLTGPETEVYAAVSALQAGDVVDVTGFVYWYNGVNTHITAVTK